MDPIAGKFQVIKLLGQGGFGQVFHCRHLELGMEYAVKVINIEKARDPQFVERFRREAQALASLYHRNAVALREYGKTSEGFPYMAMDICQGIPLQQLVRQQGHLPAARALNIIAQVLDVLEEAHNLGIIHRDLKPENIMVQTLANGNDQVKVLDFGLAKLEEGISDRAVTLTKSGMIVGTPMFMSPEQSSGNKVDGRSDLYAVGLILYACLCGRWPFPNEGPMDTMLRQIKEYPPYLNSIPGLDVPDPVERLVWQSIQKIPPSASSEPPTLPGRVANCNRLPIKSYPVLSISIKYPRFRETMIPEMRAEFPVDSPPQLANHDLVSTMETLATPTRQFEAPSQKIDNPLSPSFIAGLEPAAHPTSPTPRGISRREVPAPIQIQFEEPPASPVVTYILLLLAGIILGGVPVLFFGPWWKDKAPDDNPVATKDQGKKDSKKPEPTFAFWMKQARMAYNAQQFKLAMQYAQKALAEKFSEDLVDFRYKSELWHQRQQVFQALMKGKFERTMELVQEVEQRESHISTQWLETALDGRNCMRTGILNLQRWEKLKAKFGQDPSVDKTARDAVKGARERFNASFHHFRRCREMKKKWRKQNYPELPNREKYFAWAQKIENNLRDWMGKALNAEKLYEKLKKKVKSFNEVDVVDELEPTESGVEIWD